MTLLFYLKPSNDMIVGPHQWAPEFQWGGELKRKKKKTIKEQRSERYKFLSKDDEEIIIALLKFLDD